MRVHLFIPCLARTLEQRIGAAAQACLQAAGCEVLSPPDPACCGQVFFNAGEPERARALAQRFVRTFAGAEHVVMPTGSCLAFISSRYPGLLHGQDLKTFEDLRGRCRELSDFLVNVAGIGAWSGTFAARAALHWSCHLPRDEGLRTKVEGLLHGIAGLVLLPRPAVALPDECCGFGGVFFVLKRDLSASIGARRLRTLGLPDLVITLEPGCTLQLREAARDCGSKVRSVHLAEVLAEATGAISPPLLVPAWPKWAPGEQPVVKATDQAMKSRARVLQGQDWQAMRGAAKRVRGRSVDQIGPLLDRLKANLQSQGVDVVVAADGQDARAYVAEVAKRHKARLVVKAKTMTAEEVALLGALEAEGCRVVETDLGEHIVQVRGERPSHVTAPAIHLSRGEIADLFIRTYGMPPNDNPGIMAGFVRGLMRQAFLAADMGVIGVNIAVASTGSLLTVTNEGNGRMCATLPPVLVAIAGVEKVVETEEDAAAILRVLAPSATGQAATSYVSVLRGPRQEGEAFGPREVHLVLVDNGRLRAARDPLFGHILSCIRCGACMNACPVYRSAGGHAYPHPYPGPMGMGFMMVTGGLQAADDVAYMCTLCGECERVCPVGIPIPEMVLAIRARAPKSRQRKAAMAALSFTFKQGRRLELAKSLAQVMARRMPDLYQRLAVHLGWTHPIPPPACDEPPPVFDAIARPTPGPIEMPLQKARLELGPQDLWSKFEQAFAAAGGEIVGDLANLGLEPGLALVDRIGETMAGQLEAAGFTVMRSDDPHLDREKAASAVLGVTGCLALVAETGSILLGHSPTWDRVASMLPPVHLVVPAGASLVQTIKEALALSHGLPAATVVTGPSRTADIEKVLVMGMHGPARVLLLGPKS